MMKTIYLAGPVSGRPREEYMLHFDDAAGEIRRRIAANKLDITVFNPAGYCEGVVEDGSPWHVYMRACIEKLARCDGIGLLQGWERSRGALLEHELACTLKIPVVYVEAPVDFLTLSHPFEEELINYFAARFSRLQAGGVSEDTALDRAAFETCHRYLDPHGFENVIYA
ncbi:MAG: DUF4406 domain-containing protein [Treponema sp.]|jgi:hypothetical protein|nr:DUF4406 domain-containing protein [Treponema sp.]